MDARVRPDRASSQLLPSYARCFCCGAENDCGLRLSFYAAGDRAWTQWTPEERHGGYRGIVHGGVLAAVLDETMGWGVYLGSKLMVMTAELTVRYVRSVPVGEPLIVQGWMTQNQRDRLVHGAAEIADVDGQVCMKAKGRFMPLTMEQVREVQSYLTDPEELQLEYRNR